MSMYVNSASTYPRPSIFISLLLEYDPNFSILCDVIFIIQAPYTVKYVLVFVQLVQFRSLPVSLVFFFSRNFLSLDFGHKSSTCTSLEEIGSNSEPKHCRLYYIIRKESSVSVFFSWTIFTSSPFFFPRRPRTFHIYLNFIYYAMMHGIHISFYPFNRSLHTTFSSSYLLSLSLVCLFSIFYFVIFLPFEWLEWMRKFQIWRQHQ